MFEQITIDVSCSILHVYRTRRSTLLLVSRKKRLTCTCVRWYADCGSQSRLKTSFLGYDKRLFILERYQTRRYHLCLIIDSSKVCDSRTTAFNDFSALSSYSGISIIPFLCRIRLDGYMRVFLCSFVLDVTSRFEIWKSRIFVRIDLICVIE